MDRLLPAIVSALIDLAAAARHSRPQRPARARARRPRAARRRAGRRRARQRDGHRDRHRYDVDLRRGQKTGLFLDQRENRAAAALVRARPAARLLQLQRRVCARAWPHVRARRSPSTCPRTRSRASRQNAARNGIAVDARVGNVFDELRGLERLGERFDTIVLDPPAFAKNKAAVANARAGYKEINLRALKLLNPGGTLVTCSCSYNVNEGDVRRDRLRGVGRRAGPRDGGREADAGTRPSGAARRARDLLPEMLHPPKGRVSESPATAAAERAPRAEADGAARRRFRRAAAISAARAILGFYNVGTDAMRALARIDSCGAPARLVDRRRHGVRRRADRRSVSRSEIGGDRGGGPVSPRLHAATLPRWKRWLAGNHSANWATTDAICGCLIGR